MAIRHYDHKHDTVAEVRTCTAEQPTATLPAAMRAKLTNAHKTSPIAEVAQRPAWTPTMANEGQNKYVQGLSEKRDYRFAWDKSVDVAHFLSAEASHKLWNFLKGKALTSREASMVIDELKGAPRKANAPVSPAPAGAGTAEGSPAVAGYTAKVRKLRDQVPDGRYAVNVPGFGQDKLQFFRISTGKTGFTRVGLYSSDMLNPVQWSQYAKVLEAIAQAGAAEAGKVYAEKIGKCYKCNRQLTDEHNAYKVFGLGPDCGPKVMG